MLTFPHKVWDSGSITADAYSNKFHIKHGSNWSAHFVYTGTLSGTIELWASNKPKPSEANDTDWVKNATFTVTNPAGGSDKAFIEVGNSSGYHYRFKYVDTSGTGSIEAWVHGKTQAV